MPRNKVFISYPTDDMVIAGSLNQAIAKMPEGRLDVFLDRENIGGGQRIPKAIQEALRETVYFVGIATDVARRSFDWCGLELGFYQGSTDEQNRRETCLFHLIVPDVFVDTRSYKVQSLSKEQRDQFLDETVLPANSQIYEFLLDLAKLNSVLHPPQNVAQYWQECMAWAQTHSVAITMAFFTTLQTRVEDTWYPQGRVYISIDHGDFYKGELRDIPADAQVTLSPTMYNTFSAGVPEKIRPINWERMKVFLRENSGNEILAHMMVDIAISALPSKADAKGDYIYQAPNQHFYRVILVKHSVYGNRRRDFTFNLIRTLEKVKGGDDVTTTVVAGIVLGSKYRSLFLEEGAKYDITTIKNLNPEQAALCLAEMFQDIDRISADAASDGLADFTSLQKVLGEGRHIKDLFDRWWTVFPPMERAAKQLLDAPNKALLDEFVIKFEQFVEVSRVNNRQFLSLCLDVYGRLLSSGREV